ncbi:helix-turn-helix transcriptional regulator [Methylobacterium sp. NPDC080182]|uniref:helix-turn-helix transcriptional regulator n=1 Tax=Methylobacterium sp. NPDC080182 TaxID=3390590 RepID=UPI003D075282
MHPRQGPYASKVHPAQIRGARAMLGWTQNDLAVRSGVAKRSIAGLELETSRPKLETIRRIVATLSGGGIEFDNSDVDGIGIRLKMTSRNEHKSTDRK